MREKLIPGNSVINRNLTPNFSTTSVTLEDTTNRTQRQSIQVELPNPDLDKTADIFDDEWQSSKPGNLMKSNANLCSLAGTQTKRTCLLGVPGFQLWFYCAR